MKFSQSLILTLISLGLLLGACAGGGEQATTSESSPAASAPEAGSPETSSPVAQSPTASETTAQTESGHDHSVSQGGQVIESGPYHLELVTLKEESGVHLDFYLQKGDTHEAIPNATVTGQVQLPDGSQQSVDFEYDTEGKHYAAILPATALGNYQVAVLTDINGEKVNGRFNFSQ